MPPIYVKGGVWTNVEDEILKAAIAKYGLNQWSRVSSLLTKKTAKQCKQRWQEWLNPTIKKLDWDKQEDEKLLKLIKLRPNQWNSIGLLMNRSVNQCIERYQQLLSDSMEGGSELKMIGNVEGVDALNMNAESKPARPDFEEMDDDEKEMLSEARARLANTQGKKAKRKARERMLEESKRIAMLQRRRELKQVGINTGIKNKKKFATQMDYNADIAFERRPIAGRFNVDEEEERNLVDKVKFDKVTDKTGTFNQEVAKQNRKEKQRRKELKKMNNVTFESSEKIYGEEDEVSKRPKLVFSDSKEEEEGDIDDRIARTTREINERKNKRSVLFGRHEEAEESDEKEVIVPPIKRVKVEHNNLKRRKKELAKKLMNLPKPLNNYELVDISEEGGRDRIVSSVGLIDKGRVRDERKRQEEARKEIIKELRMSQAVKLKLPIPRVKADIKKEIGDDAVSNEMIRMIESDYRTHILGKTPEGEDEKLQSIDIDRERRIRSGVETMIEEEEDKLENSLEEYEKEVFNDEIDTSVDTTLLIELIKWESKYSASLEKVFNDGIGEYMERGQKLSDILAGKMKELRQLEQDLGTYERLAEEEEIAIGNRSQLLQKGIDRMNEVISEALLAE
ncbi:DEKNAAC101192 [Brettanomyces naardenensis]|uniref:Pre-mRNA-splicing factor CEF1 n=1 Tax=Brettanomyces naardenensis TaxID=13370 RepID=A0A448YHD2_BRENA|nr:DEKNAAC101192 [Brettanomyces naardenensis]